MTFDQLDRDEFIKQTKTQTVIKQANHYGVTERTIYNWRERLLGVKKAKSLPMSKAELAILEATAFPPNANGAYLDVIQLVANRCMILGDAEIPDHDRKMFEMAVYVARRHHIDTLIINGDFLALDSFSKWARSQVYKLAFQEELEPALISLQVFLKTFKRIVYLTGNHERRLAHALEGHVTIGAFLRELKNVEFTEYAYVKVRSGERDWLVCHQKNFSIVPMSVPKKICESRHTNIWCAHNHRLGWAYDPSGKYYLVEGGHCRSELHTAYKMTQVTTHPAWNPGFGLLLGGVPYLIDLNNVDFWMDIKLPKEKEV
jgi:hypothetical protein